jgi:hypothetical protein
MAAANVRDYRTYRYRHLAARRPRVRDAIGDLLETIPNDVIPFGTSPRFDEFYAKLDIVFKTFLRNLYVPAAGVPATTARLGAARRGMPKHFDASRVPDLVEHGRSFAELWNDRFADVLGRASAFLSVVESDVFVSEPDQHVEQIGNFLTLMAGESRPEDLVLFECARILKNVSHVRLLGPHDRLQDSLVVVAATSHLLELALKSRRSDDQDPLWDRPLESQRGYAGRVQLTFGELIRHSLIRAMDPGLYDTDCLTPRALIEEPGYRSESLTSLRAQIWPEAATSAILQMIEALPSTAHDDLDCLLAEVFLTPHAQWQQDPWFQSPYVSITVASATQVFLNVLSASMAGPLPLADLAFFPMFRRDEISRLTAETNRFSTSLADAIQPTIERIERETFFGLKNDFPVDRIVFGPIHRRLSGPEFTHMPADYLAALRNVARRMSFARLDRVLDAVESDDAEVLPQAL